MVRAALITLVALLASGCSGSSAPEPEVTGTIAFTRGDDVWLMRADGSGQRRLTRGDDPAWSPDGRRIALSVDRNRAGAGVSGSRLWVIDADGRNLRGLTTAEHPYDTHTSPVWSPDGKTIAYQGYDDGNYWIDVVGADAGGQRQLTPKAGPYWDTDPVWSRDGRAIMYSSGRNTVYVKPDGSGRRVVASVEETWNPGVVWSPDRRRFTALIGGDLWVLRADGTRLAMLFEDLVDKPERWSGIAWSPDGRKIAFSVREGRGASGEADTEIYVVDSDGRELRKLTDNDVLDDLESWSPDGRAIAFTTNRDGQSEVYLMDADGRDQRNLSLSPASDYGAAWSPRTAP